MPAKSRDQIWKRQFELQITIEGEIQEEKRMWASQQSSEDATLELEIIYLRCDAGRFPFLLLVLEATPLSLIVII